MRQATFLPALLLALPLAALGMDLDRKVAFNIPAQDLSGALIEFSKQARLQVIVSDDLTGQTTQGVIGQKAIKQALSQLLEPAGLRYRVASETSITVGKASTMENQATRAALEDSPLRLAAVSSSDMDSTQSSYLEEIVVTAQKREERQSEVPMSIVALGADELQKRRIITIDDLPAAVPGLTIRNGTGGARQITLRGISNAAGASSLIGLYLDEASVTLGPVHQLDLRTYDLQRVEVLRGPQGTLYGEGSVGGTVRFITRDPVMDGFALNADVAALFTEDGDPGQRIEGVINLPLIKDTLAMRIAGTFDHQGGWVDQPAADREDFNDQNVANVRMKTLWRPTAQFAVNAMAVIHRNDAGSGIGEDEHGVFTQWFNQTTTPTIKDEYDLYNLTLSYDLPAVRILSSSSYIDQEKQGRNYGFTFPINPPGTPQFSGYGPLQVNGGDSFTEELRLTSVGSGPLQWTIGAFYRRARIDLATPAGLYFGIAGPPGSPLPAPFAAEQRTESVSWAAFGDASYQVTDRFSLGVGLRHFEDEQEFDAALGGSPLPTQTGTFDATNPRVYARYELTQQINAYASAAKGFRSGGFTVGQPSYAPEGVWTYEVGTKMSLLQSALSTELALFYSNYQDYQIPGFNLDPPGNYTSNAGSASIKGVEWSLLWRPLDRWSMGLNGNYLRSRFYQINSQSTPYVVGDPVDLFPKYGFTASLQRDVQWNGKSGFARIDFGQQGRAPYRNRNALGPTPDYFSESDVISLLNANLGLEWSETLALSFFAQNLLNERGSISPTVIDGSASRPRPRTYGVGFTVSFE